MSDDSKLLDAHQRLLHAHRVAGLGFIDWDLGSNAVIVSEETRRMLGLHPFERHFTIDDILARVHPDDRGDVRALLEATVRGEAEFVLDHRYVRLDGSVLWVHAQAALTRAADGAPAALLGTFLDITARKEVELALRDSEERLRLALDATGIGIWDWNLLADRRTRIGSSSSCSACARRASARSTSNTASATPTAASAGSTASAGRSAWMRRGGRCACSACAST